MNKNTCPSNDRNVKQNLSTSSGPDHRPFQLFRFVPFCSAKKFSLLAQSIHSQPPRSFSMLSSVKLVHSLMPLRLIPLLTLACVCVAAAEPEVDPKDLPRFPAVEPTEATKTFVIREGFKVELAATEPNVVSPVALSFDEDGRMYVAEMRDYSEHRDEKLGRIRLLEDTDGAGVFEKSTIFAEGLPWPTAVICYGGGIFVGATPDILFLKDTNGDGKADERRVVFTGFAKDVARINVQQL